MKKRVRGNRGVSKQRRTKFKKYRIKFKKTNKNKNKNKKSKSVLYSDSLDFEF